MAVLAAPDARPVPDAPAEPDDARPVPQARAILGQTIDAQIQIQRDHMRVMKTQFKEAQRQVRLLGKRKARMMGASRGLSVADLAALLVQRDAAP